jgi:hypothetical protein
MTTTDLTLITGSNEWWIVRRGANGDARRPWYGLTNEDRAALTEATTSATITPVPGHDAQGPEDEAGLERRRVAYTPGEHDRQIARIDRLLSRLRALTIPARPKEEG